MQDALPLILKHPFGLGYYGYYFIQQSVQTGVYTVVNAHNELIQILLDAGVIPAVFMGAAVLRSVFTKRTQSRNRIVLSIMILHSLFDYDFQFLAMGFVLILFLDMRNIKTQKVPVLTGTVVGLTGAAAAALSIMCGVRTFAIRREIIKRLKKFTVEIQWRSWLFLRKRIRRRK
mgnify:CR=1 FL=1